MGCILPTMHCRSQHCWELLHPFAHHCQHGRNNSQYCWRNNVRSCCARLHAAETCFSTIVLSTLEIALRFFACCGIHYTLWLLVRLSNTLITLNTYSRLMSHINTLQSSPPAVKTYFPSYEHTKLDTYEKDTTNNAAIFAIIAVLKCLQFSSLSLLNICPSVNSRLTSLSNGKRVRILRLRVNGRNIVGC